MKPCWSCGAQNRRCYIVCRCAKCVDPADYARWRADNPEEYKEWLDRQKRWRYGFEY